MIDVLTNYHTVALFETVREIQNSHDLGYAGITLVDMAAITFGFDDYGGFKG